MTEIRIRKIQKWHVSAKEGIKNKSHNYLENVNKLGRIRVNKHLHILREMKV